MIDGQFVELFLSWLENYGPSTLGFIMFTSAIGVPFPVTPILITSGAFARLGFFELPPSAFYIFAGAVTGDAVAYFIGRFAGDWAERLAGKRFGIAWEKAQNWFNRYGAWAILLSRWLLNSLDVPINLIAGASHYDFWKYLFFVVLGRSIWIVLYGGLGYAFSSQYELITQLIERYTVWAGVALVVVISLYILLRKLLKGKLDKLPVD